MCAIPVIIATGSLIETVVVILTTVVIAIPTLTEALILIEALIVVILSMVIDTIVITTVGIKVGNYSGPTLKIQRLKLLSSRYQDSNYLIATLAWKKFNNLATRESPMTIMTLKAIRRADLATLTITDRDRAINALKMVRMLSAAPNSLAEAHALAEIADYWASKNGDDGVSWKSRTSWK
jgi:hypothetical protein